MLTHIISTVVLFPISLIVGFGLGHVLLLILGFGQNKTNREKKTLSHDNATSVSLTEKALTESRPLERKSLTEKTASCEHTPINQAEKLNKNCNTNACDHQERKPDDRQSLPVSTEKWGLRFLETLEDHPEFDKAEMLPFRKAFELCESQPEILLLQALVRYFHLSQGADGTLNGNGIRLQCQAWRFGYRPDFIINNKLIIEVDGRRYHENEDSFSRDRIRDQKLITKGYVPARFPAWQVYQERNQCIDHIQGALNTLEAGIGIRDANLAAARLHG